MKINLQGITNSLDRKRWEEKGYMLPQYDIAQMVKATKENPFWIHFGAGNLFRAFHAVIAQNLLNEGKIDRGILVAEGFDYEIIEKMYTLHDNLGIAVTLKTDGTIDKSIVGSVAQALPLDSADDMAFAQLKGIFANDSLQMATFTITEKGYSLTNAEGELLQDVAADFAAGPEKPTSYTLEEMLDDIRLAEDIIYSANPVLNSILKIKVAKAKGNGIDIRVHVFIPQKVSVEIGDMGVLYRNLLDNAIEACCQVVQEKRFIEFDTKYQEGNLFVLIKNSKTGKENKEMATTKKDKRKHGRGVRAVQRVAEKYGGNLILKDWGDVFEAKLLLTGIGRLE